MKLALRVGVAALSMGVLFAGALGVEIHRLTGVTSPESALPTSGKRRALVVLDVQEDYTGKTARAPFPYAGASTLITRVNRAIERAEATGADVIYVRQVFERPMSKLVSQLFLGGTVLEGAPGAELDRRVHLVSPHRFEKPFADAFSSQSFEAFVASHDIGELVLVGLDGAGCIDKTARGARNRGLE